MPCRLPQKFRGLRFLGAVLVSLAAMLLSGTAWSQAPSGPLVAAGFLVSTALPVLTAPTATTSMAAPATIGVAPLPPTLNNPLNRNPATRAATSVEALRPASASAAAAAPSNQGFGSPPVSRDTLVAPDPSRDGAPAAL